MNVQIQKKNKTTFDDKKYYSNADIMIEMFTIGDIILKDKRKSSYSDGLIKNNFKKYSEDEISLKKNIINNINENNIESQLDKIDVITKTCNSSESKNDVDNKIYIEKVNNILNSFD